MFSILFHFNGKNIVSICYKNIIHITVDSYLIWLLTQLNLNYDKLYALPSLRYGSVDKSLGPSWTTACNGKIHHAVLRKTKLFTRKYWQPCTAIVSRSINHAKMAPLGDTRSQRPPRHNTAIITLYHYQTACLSSFVVFSGSFSVKCTFLTIQS